MKIAFFVSSVGDTDLAKATILKLIEQSACDAFVIPLTTTALDRVKELEKRDAVTITSLDQVVGNEGALLRDELTASEIELVISYLTQNQIDHAYFGVPSSNNEIPYQIASHVTIPFTIVYEYMFKPMKHLFWRHLSTLTALPNSQFAVPLSSAFSDIQAHHSSANLRAIGHLSLDRMQDAKWDQFAIEKTRRALSIRSSDEMAFVSATTQPTEVDNAFVRAILTELSTNRYPSIQLRMGLHPGTKDISSYLQTILKTCQEYPSTSSQFQIIVNTKLATQLETQLHQNPFILHADVSGPEAAQVADKITQAVPGALLNEAAMKGKPAYFHDATSQPYLPKDWFASSVVGFFAAKPQSPHVREEIGLSTDSAPDELARFMLSARSK